MLGRFMMRRCLRPAGLLLAATVGLACGDDGGTTDAGAGTTDAGADTSPATGADDGETAPGDGASTVTAATGDGSGGGTVTTSASDGMSTGDPCDCVVGAYAPVCGVDSMTYDAACGIECVPVDVACNGECPCPEVVCNGEPCPADEPVCNSMVPGVPGGETTYMCGPLPDACLGLADPTCACFEPLEIDCTCNEYEPDRFEIHCLGA